MPEKTYTTEEAAEELMMHPVTLMKKIRAGKILAGKPAKRWIILQSEIDRQLAPKHVSISDRLSEKP